MQVLELPIQYFYPVTSAMSREHYVNTMLKKFFLSNILPWVPKFYCFLSPEKSRRAAPPARSAEEKK